MPNDKPQSGSKLPVSFKKIDNSYEKPERRNALVSAEKYDKLDNDVKDLLLGTNGVLYIPENAFPTLFQTTKPNAAYIYENQIPENDKRNIDGLDCAHSASVVGLLVRKTQEVREADKQALLQYGRDTLINISDSGHFFQEMRRQLDTFTQRTLPKLRKARGVLVDEVTGEPLRKKAAFHHMNPKELHTDPEDILDPSKGRNLNLDTHQDVHRNNINDEAQFEAYKKSRNKK